MSDTLTKVGGKGVLSAKVAAIMRLDRERQSAPPDTKAGRKAARQNRVRQEAIDALKTGAPQAEMLALLSEAARMRQGGHFTEAKAALMSCLELATRYRSRLQRGKKPPFGAPVLPNVIRWLRCDHFISLADSKTLLRLIDHPEANNTYVVELYAATHKFCADLAHLAGLEGESQPDETNGCRQAAVERPKPPAPPPAAHYRAEAITQRECDVLELVVAGKTTRQIASILDLPPISIKNYKSRILKKLDSPNAADLIRIAAPALADPPPAGDGK